MPKKNKLISIVMPVRNEERYLAVAVERALSQELPSGYRSEVVLALAPLSDATQSIAEGRASFELTWSRAREVTIYTEIEDAYPRFYGDRDGTALVVGPAL